MKMIVSDLERSIVMLMAVHRCDRTLVATVVSGLRGYAVSVQELERLFACELGFGYNEDSVALLITVDAFVMMEPWYRKAALKLLNGRYGPDGIDHNRLHS